MKSNRGFTLIEMLASIVIMGLLVTAVLGPLTSLFKNTRTNGQSLQKTTQAQNVLEFVKGQWKPYPRMLFNVAAGDPNFGQDQNSGLRAASRQRYDSTCYDPTGLTVPAGTSYSIVVNAVDRNGNVGTPISVTASTNCAGLAVAAVPPLMKRVTVSVSSPDAPNTILSTNVARP